MDDNEVLLRPHPCHDFLGRIFMLSNYTASGTAPSGQDPSATHRATAPHGKEQARGKGHYVTASKSKLISMQPQYAVHPGTGPFRRAATSHAYRNSARRAESKSYVRLCQHLGIQPASKSRVFPRVGRADRLPDTESPYEISIMQQKPARSPDLA